MPPSRDLPVLGSSYRALSLLAKGGMGAVYLCEAVTDDAEPRVAAVKVMHRHLSSAAGARMFADEARLGKQICHPNVVRVLATDVADERPWLAMEYIEGLTWAQVVDRMREEDRPVPVDVCVRVVHDALLGLGAAHALTWADRHNAGIIHRDVSPQNVLVGTDGRARILDFGVATFRGRSLATASGVLRGKLGYMSPEQVVRDHVDQRADIFSAGVILWEALARRRLFVGATPMETLAQVLGEPIPPPSTFSPDLDEGLEDACLRALERDRARRYASAGEFASALAALGPLARDERIGAFIRVLGAAEIERNRKAIGAAERERAASHPSVTVKLEPRTARPSPIPCAPLELPAVPRVRLLTPGVWSWALLAAAVLLVMGTIIGRKARAEPSVATAPLSDVPASSGPATPPTRDPARPRAIPVASGASSGPTDRHDREEKMHAVRRSVRAPHPRVAAPPSAAPPPSPPKPGLYIPAEL